MTRLMVDLESPEHRDAARIAAEAGRLLLEVRRGADEAANAGALGARGDRDSHDFIVGELRRLYPDDGILSEEGRDDSARLAKQRVWIVDPLDGTREFGEQGRTDWAVHVAMAVCGTPTVGAVSLPALSHTFSTGSPPGIPPRPDAPLRLVASRTRAPSLLTDLASELSAELVYMGSAGAKTMAVVMGEADAYVHAGGQYEWDSAAPVAVALAAGLHASRLDGSQLRYNQQNPYLPDQLVCRPELADRILAALRSRL